MVIGFRTFKDGFSYVVLNGVQAEPKVVGSDRLTFPKAAEWPESLSWVRKQASEIYDQFNLSGACIKTIEPIAMKKSKERLQIEAVLIEYLHTERGISCSSRIKSQLKRDIETFNKPARYLESILEENQNLQELDHPNFREACLAAISELPA